MNQKMGAHEIMEIHEVLTDTIDGINLFRLYRPHVQCRQLTSILNNQIRFLTDEYNRMVQFLQQRSQESAIPEQQPTTGFQQPVYGLDNPATQSPNPSVNMLDDRDVASGMLGCSKSSATLRMHAALECADPQIRQIMVQSAVSCSQQAFETFQYMNQRGFYQVPTMQERTMNAIFNTYQPAPLPETEPGGIQ